MASPPFESYAQNGEDVVLWRALGGVADGRYIDVGAHHPSNDSVSRAFYDHGWRGITIEPLPDLAELQRQERPGDIVVEAAITSGPDGATTLHEVLDTGLSTLVDSIGDSHRDAGRQTREISVRTLTLDQVLQDAGWDGHDIHFLSVDAEGSETAVLQSIDFEVWRPWVLVIESVAPNSSRPTHQHWEKIVTDAGYRFCLFDGLSRFYVANEHAEKLGAQLAAPANVGDNFTTLRQRELLGRLEEAAAQRQAAIRQSVQWRTVALERWGELMENATLAVGAMAHEHERLRQEYDAMHATLSWRITRPLRALRERLPRKEGGE